MNTLSMNNDKVYIENWLHHQRILASKDNYYQLIYYLFFYLQIRLNMSNINNQFLQNMSSMSDHILYSFIPPDLHNLLHNSNKVDLHQFYMQDYLFQGKQHINLQIPLQCKICKNNDIFDILKSHYSNILFYKDMFCQEQFYCLYQSQHHQGILNSCYLNFLRYIYSTNSGIQHIQHLFLHCNILADMDMKA